MFKRVFFITMFVLGLGVSNLSYAKVLNLGVNLRYGMISGENFCVMHNYKSNGEEIDTFNRECAKSNDSGLGGTLSLDFPIVFGMYVGLHYNFDLLYTDKLKEATSLHELMPVFGWNSPTMVGLFSLFVEMGFTLWDQMSLDQGRYEGFTEANIIFDYMAGFGANFHLSDWLSIIVKQSSYFRFLELSYLDDDDAELEFYFNLESGVMFSF